MSSFTIEASDAIVEALGEGLSLREGAARAGVKYETARGWLRRGRRAATGELHEFAREVDEARANYATAQLDEPELVKLLERAARKGSVQAAKFLLQRIDRTRDARPGWQDDLEGGIAALYRADDLARRSN